MLTHEKDGVICSDPKCWCKKFNDKWSGIEYLRPEMLEEDMVNHPPHYQLEVEGSPLEAIQVIEAALTPEEFRGYLKGNCLKYLIRSNQKNGQEDLQKMAFYSEYFKK